MPNIKRWEKTAAFISIVACAGILLGACRFSSEEDDDPHMGTPTNYTNLHVASIADGTTKLIAEADNALFIPGTTKILYGHQDSLFTINYDGSQKSFIARVPNIQMNSLAISPDGRTAIATTEGVWNATLKSSLNAIVKIALESRSVDIVYQNEKAGFSSPRFYLNSSQIVFYESPRGGLSLIGINGSGYTPLTPDDNFCIYLGSTANNTRLVMIGKYYSSFDSSYTQLLLVNADTHGVDAAFDLPGDFIESPSVRITNDMMVYYKTRNVIAKYDLSAKTRTVLYSRYLDSDCAISNDVSKAVIIFYPGASVLNLQNGQLTSFEFSHPQEYSNYYSHPQFSPDDKYFLILNTYTVWH